MTFGSLFAGIGGFDLGLERAGMVPRWQVENNPFSQHILNKHWPDVPCYGDIREVRGEEVEPVDIICGGFPCQDISNAGRRAGIEGARSSLWGEYARLVGELRPRYVIVENVAALRRRGLDRVLGDLAALGYDAEWDGIRASDIGAPHKRDRIWIVAYPNGNAGHERRPRDTGEGAARRDADRGGLGADVPDPSGTGPQGLRATVPTGDGRRPGPLADTGSIGRERGQAQRRAGGCSTERLEASDHACIGGCPSDVADPDPQRRDGGPRVFGPGRWSESADSRAGLAASWAIEPDVGRVAHGVPARVDRLTGLGNALVPQIAEWIGHRINEYEGLGPITDADEAGLNGR